QRYVSMARKEIGFAFDQCCPIATLPECACAAIGAVEALHVSAANSLHDVFDGILASRRHQQVHVVGHEDVRMDLATLPLTRGLKTAAEEAVVDVPRKHRASVVTALDDMLPHPGRGVAGQASETNTAV